LVGVRVEEEAEEAKVRAGAGRAADAAEARSVAVAWEEVWMVAQVEATREEAAMALVAAAMAKEVPVVP
jgi:hypothetical protein